MQPALQDLQLDPGETVVGAVLVIARADGQIRRFSAVVVPDGTEVMEQSRDIALEIMCETRALGLAVAKQVVAQRPVRESLAAESEFVQMLHDSHVLDRERK